jgi:hypothetical protein
VNESKIRQIWAALDRARSTYRAHDLVSQIDVLTQAGLEVGPEELEILLQRLPGGGDFYLSVDLARFVADFIAPTSPKSILDPWAGYGILAATVAARLHPARFDAFNKNAQAHSIIHKLASGGALTPRLVDPLEELMTTESRYDVVVSCPPFGYRSDRSVSLIIDDKPREIRDDYGHLLILQACQRLNSDGLAAFVVLPRFMLEEKPAGVRLALRDLGFQVLACIEFPSGTFLPMTAVPTYLVAIKRGDPRPLFVAQYSRDPAHQEVIRSNFLEGREGKHAAQGRLVGIEDFKGFPVLAALERVQDLAKRMGLEEIRFGSIVAEVNQTRSGRDFVRLPEKPNSVYLPLMAATPATTSQDRLPDRLKSYVQLVIKEEVAEAAFVAGLLNTTLGLAIRDIARRGATIPRIHPRELLDTPFFLPPFDVQRKVVAAQATLGRLRNELNELESSLWRRPRAIDKVEAEIRRLNKEDRFQDWIESLPFPLASVLWRYHAYKGPPREAYERLLAFFEVLAEFCAVMHLSAFSSSNILWEHNRGKIKERLDENALSLDRATFGTWKLCVEFLSSEARRVLDKSPELCFEMYRTRDQRVLEAITSKKIAGVLQEANEIRNAAYGHVGAMGETTARHIRNTLLDRLSQVREVFGGVWTSYELLQPLKCEYRDGVFYYDAHRIMGTRSMPFETVELELTEAVESGRLHLRSPGETRTLMMLPMIKIMPSPKTAQNACYLYNRRQQGGIRFLSYHFESDADVVEPFEDTERMLNTLFGQGG